MIGIESDFPILTAEKQIEIRFSEVDSMNIVWHGSYPLYFEDARETFGEKFGLGYLDIFGNGYYAPLVELSFKYKRPLTYGMKPVIRITYVPTDAAKIVFDYEIIHHDEVMATGRSVQVFMDKQYQLVWDNPAFYRRWKLRMADSIK